MSHLVVFALLGCSEQNFKPIDDPSNLEPDDTGVDVPTVPTEDPDDPDPDPPTAEPLFPEIEVTPLFIDFGAQAVGSLHNEVFQVSNIGEADLNVSAIEIFGSTAFAIDGSTSFVLTPGEDTFVGVAFVAEAGASSATAWVHSDDADESITEVSLVGTGAVPDLDITPVTYDFGPVELTCDSDKDVFLSNIGGDTLVIDSIQLTDPLGNLTLNHGHVLPLSLQPGESVPVEVVFAPGFQGLSNSTLTVVSNDPDGDATATQMGEGFVTSGSDSAVAPPDPPLDILFAVDQSGSMDDRNADMADALDDFIGGLSGVTQDWRIGVVTYDDGCLNTWFDASTPNFGNAFQTAVQEGSQNNPNNEDTERLFALAGRALVATGPGGCNSTFRRPDGFLHLIMISDENEQSHDPGETAVPYDTIGGALAVYESYVQSPSMLTVSAVANITNSCQSQNDALAQGADRYIDMANQTGGQALDICNDLWGPQMANLGSTLPSEYDVALSQTPDPSSIRVSVDGSVLFGGWTYDAATNTVTVTNNAGSIGPGSVMDVEYTIPPICPP